jgi:cleavage and polyadenylation specificity factor subunit 2
VVFFVSKVTFDIREEAVGLGQPDSVAKYGIGESVGRSGEVLEDDYGISVQPDRFTDIVSGVDPSKFASGTGRIGEDVLRRGFGNDMDNTGHRKVKVSSTPASASNASRVISDVDEQDDDMDGMNDHALEALDLSEGNGIIRGRNGRLPTKVSRVPRKLNVLAEISYIPGLEGRVDARAARQSIRALHPREVIVLGGTRDEIAMTIPDKSINYNLVSDEVRLLAEAAQSFVKGGKVVWTPSDGETVELDVGHSAFSVRLVDTPYRTAAMIAADRANNIEPEAIEPFETKLGLCNVSSVDFVATGQKVALDGSLVLAPRTPSLLDNEDDVPSIYLSDGEILLTNLRAELIALGMKAEYSAHTGYSQLLINGKILVRKEQNLDGPGRMQIEGPLCEDFYSVRAILYGQYIVL